MAWCDEDPGRAREALQRGLAIAQDAGIRYNITHFANVLGRLEGQHGDVMSALDYLRLAIGNYHDSGNAITIRIPLASLAACLGRLGHAEGAAVLAGYSAGHITRAWLPELAITSAHLRDVLGADRYDELSSQGKAMTTAAVVAYAYDRMDQARAQLQDQV